METNKTSKISKAIINQPVKIRIVELRNIHGMKQSELATTLGLTNSMLSKYENGRNYPALPILLTIARVLNSTVDYLVSTCPVNFAPMLNGIMADQTMRGYIRNVLFNAKFGPLVYYDQLPDDIIEERIDKIIAIITQSV